MVASVRPLQHALLLTASFCNRFNAAFLHVVATIYIVLSSQWIACELRILPMTTTAIAISRTEHQRCLRNVVKRLVTELGYPEHCLAGGLQDAASLQAAVSGIDRAILLRRGCANDHVNEHLASC